MPPKTAVQALPASPPVISLLSSAEILPVNKDSNRWEAGVTYETEACTSAGTGLYAACETANLSSSPASDIVTLEPYVVWAGDSCSLLGSAVRDWKGRAQRKLIACESSIIERELWRGDVVRATSIHNPHLTDGSGTVVVTEGTAAGPLPALACLEQALGDCNCGVQGMIHATRQVVTNWVAANLVIRDGNRLRTQLGTIVVPGAGYDGSGPSDGANPIPAATGSIWAYATSMVHIRLSPVQVLPDDLSEATDRVTNTATYWAQRYAVFGFDCCHFAAEIDLALCETGS